MRRLSTTPRSSAAKALATVVRLVEKVEEWAGAIVATQMIVKTKELRKKQFVIV